MMRIQTTNDYINALEKFIECNKPKEEICISPKDYEDREEALKLIKKDKENSLYLFGGSGYRSNYYYKGCDNKIYMIETYFDEFDSYSVLG